MTADYRERSVLMSFNTIFGLVGNFAVTFLAWSYLGTIEGGQNNKDGYVTIAAAVGVLTIFVILFSAYFTRDQIPKLSQPPDDLPTFNASQLRF